MPFALRRRARKTLGYAENITGDATTAATGPAYEDVDGLSLTFTVGSKPVWVTCGGAVIFGNVAGARVRLLLTDEANATLNYSQATCVSASEHHPTGVVAYRVPAGSGEVTVKARFGVFSGTTVQTTLLTTGGGRIWIRAAEED